MSIRSRAPDVMYTIQCLYQNSIITPDEKNDLTKSFKALLGDEESHKLKKEFLVMLEDIFYRPQTPMFIKQQLEITIQQLQ